MVVLGDYRTAVSEYSCAKQTTAVCILRLVTGIGQQLHRFMYDSVGGRSQTKSNGGVGLYAGPRTSRTATSAQ